MALCVQANHCCINRLSTRINKYILIDTFDFHYSNFSKTRSWFSGSIFAKLYIRNCSFKAAYSVIVSVNCITWFFFVCALDFQKLLHQSTNLILLLSSFHLNLNSYPIQTLASLYQTLFLASFQFCSYSSQILEYCVREGDTLRF